VKLADWATEAYKVGFYDAVFEGGRAFYLCRYRLEDKKRLYKMGFDEGLKYKTNSKVAYANKVMKMLERSL
jgi:hypothetical protein